MDFVSSALAKCNDIDTLDTSERDTNAKEVTMTATTSEVKEFYTSAQMNWMLSKGYAWGEKPISEMDWREPIYTRHGEYMWTVPYIDRNGNVAGGRYDLVG